MQLSAGIKQCVVKRKFGEKGLYNPLEMAAERK